MYQVGDLVFYGDMGVCRITDISTQELSGAMKKQLYYILLPLYQQCVIYAPVHDGKVFMRPVISKQEADEMIDSIPSIHAEAYHNRVLGQLSEHYEESLRSHDCMDLIKLTMSIYAKKQDVEAHKRKFGSVDEKFMKRAEDLLFGEFAAVLGIAKEKVPTYIESRVSTEDWRGKPQEMVGKTA